MHYLLLCISGLVLFSTSSAPKSALEASEVGAADYVYVEFTSRTTFEDLVLAKAQLAEKKITLDYLIIEFDGHDIYNVDDVKCNNLKRLSFTVNCHDGYAGSGMSSLLLDGDRLAIVRDYRHGTKVPFGINVDPGM